MRTIRKERGKWEPAESTRTGSSHQPHILFEPHSTDGEDSMLGWLLRSRSTLLGVLIEVSWIQYLEFSSLRSQPSNPLQFQRIELVVLGSAVHFYVRPRAHKNKNKTTIVLRYNSFILSRKFLNPNHGRIVYLSDLHGPVRRKRPALWAAWMYFRQPWSGKLPPSKRIMLIGFIARNFPFLTTLVHLFIYLISAVASSR